MKNSISLKLFLLTLFSISIFSCSSDDDENSMVEEGENFTLKINVDNVEGEIGLNPDKDSYNKGEKVTLKANPKEGYVFAGWQGIEETIATDTEITVQMDKNLEVTATFDKIEDIDIEEVTGSGPVTLVMSIEHDVFDPITVVYYDGNGVKRTESVSSVNKWSRTLKISRDFDFLLEVSGTATIESFFSIKIDAEEDGNNIYSFDKRYPTGTNSSFKASIKNLDFAN
ncbi:InlB B-repeat-containing protein [Aquimarina algicola]|uniref:InlB B-repeat-containing protein n=1 Tax=Aquimarina algicola TaxID=2589995 RepID=A0A504JLM7_9FLAO|nr:InlB B-repeat-containing protein [Aquimarina algicola]TPN88698.1 InlB B-repeat-containing protein [Aquimarina algicola]